MSETLLNLYYKIHKYLYLHLTLKANQNYQNNYPTLLSKTVIFIFYADFSFVTLKSISNKSFIISKKKLFSSWLRQFFMKIEFNMLILLRRLAFTGYSGNFSTERQIFQKEHKCTVNLENSGQKFT